MSLTLRRDPDGRVTALRRDSGVTIWRRFRHRACPSLGATKLLRTARCQARLPVCHDFPKTTLEEVALRARRRDHALAEGPERPVTRGPHPGENAKRFLRSKKTTLEEVALPRA